MNKKKNAKISLDEPHLFLSLLVEHVVDDRIDRCETIGDEEDALDKQNNRELR